MLNSNWLFATSSTQMNAPHAWMKAKMPTALIALPDSGTSTRRNVHHSDAPSTRAASISSSGIAEATCWRMRKMPKLITSVGRMIAW